MILRIEQKSVDPGITVLVLIGKITLGRDSQQIEMMVQDLLKKEHKKFVLDMTAVDYIDSTGIGIVTYCFGHAKQAGGALRVAGAAGLVRDVFKMSQVDTIVPFHATLPEACAAF